MVPRAVQSPRGPLGRPLLQAVGARAPRWEAGPRAPWREVGPRLEASRREGAWPAREPSLPRASCSRTRQSTDCCFANRRSGASSNSGDVSCTQRRWADVRSAANYERLEPVHGRFPPTERASLALLACKHPVIVPRGVSLAPRQSPIRDLFLSRRQTNPFQRRVWRLQREPEPGKRRPTVATAPSTRRLRRRDSNWLGPYRAAWARPVLRSPLETSDGGSGSGFATGC